MRLDVYLRENDLSDAAFAAVLGSDVSEWAVRKWRYGQRTPRPSLIRRIGEKTNGKVTANDFHDAVLEAESRREAAAKASGAGAEMKADAA